MACRWSSAPVVFAEFNQRIDESALLSHLELRTGSDSHPFRAASEEEIAKDDNVRPLSTQAQPHRWIAIKPTEDLPKGSTVALVLDKGAPSAEGPLLTEHAQRETFRVHGPLRLETTNCGWSGSCPPLAAWSIRLSNQIDADSFDTKMVTVEPPLRGLHVDVSGRYLNVRGQSKGRTHYVISLSPEIHDAFGQALEQPANGKIDVGEAEPTLFPEQSDMLVLDPGGGRQARRVQRQPEDAEGAAVRRGTEGLGRLRQVPAGVGLRRARHLAAGPSGRDALSSTRRASATRLRRRASLSDRR